MSAETHPTGYVCRACCKVGIWLRAGLQLNEPVTPGAFEHLDGRPGTWRDIAACDACGHGWEPSDFAAMLNPACQRPREA